jgi:hypothetical protein
VRWRWGRSESLRPLVTRSGTAADPNPHLAQLRIDEDVGKNDICHSLVRQPGVTASPRGDQHDPLRTTCCSISLKYSMSIAGAATSPAMGVIVSRPWEAAAAFYTVFPDDEFPTGSVAHLQYEETELGEAAEEFDDSRRPSVRSERPASALSAHAPRPRHRVGRRRCVQYWNLDYSVRNRSCPPLSVTTGRASPRLPSRWSRAAGSLHPSSAWQSLDVLLSRIAQAGFRLEHRSTFQFPWPGEQLVLCKTNGAKRGSHPVGLGLRHLSCCGTSASGSTDQRARGVRGG